MPLPNGRPKGTRNRKTLIREDLFRKATEALLFFYPEAGMDVRTIEPLPVMLFVMRQRLSVQDLDGALIAANMAAPYMHARLSQSEVKLVNGSAKDLSDDELLARAKRMEALLIKAGKLPPLIEGVATNVYTVEAAVDTNDDGQRDPEIPA